MQQKSSVINLQHLSKKLLKENPPHNQNEPPSASSIIINPKLRIAKSLNVDSCFEKLHSKVQTQFMSEVPLFSVEEMVSMPAIDKMLSLKGKRKASKESIAATGDHEKSKHIEELKGPSTLHSKNGKSLEEVEKMLNFAHLYAEDADASPLEYYQHMQLS
eukprot:TRINITY_DN6218_c0_g1_i2.p1 TRINITY_DN6218_c0_g1~~TRINITY_DN6218_c0_g1_i2.p1  ORF type:complete len:160 (-),score=40.60 TRINITY_DN6218_c0_g1_i2:61-540(-)